MDSFEFYLNKLKSFSPNIYNNSICTGNIAYILSNNLCMDNSIWIREAGYLCDIGAVQIGPIFLSVKNKTLLDNLDIRIRLRNTRQFHVKRSMDLIDNMDDIDAGLRLCFKELVDLHHCLYDNAASYCGHNFGINKNAFTPIADEIPEDAQILSAATLLSQSISQSSYNLNNLDNIISILYNEKAISRPMMEHIIKCAPDIRQAYKDKSIFVPNITTIKQKESLVKAGIGLCSKEYGSYRFANTRRL